MRVYFENNTHPSRVAKSLKKALNESAVDFPLSKCQQILAKMTDYADWHELQSQAGKFTASPPDVVLSETQKAQRRSQYVAALVSAGVSPEISEKVIEIASPTASRPAPELDYSFMFSKFTSLAKLDLSAAAIAANPGFLDLVRRTHAAANATPFWAERAVWTAFRVISPEDTRLLTPMLRTPNHSWWGPAIVLALARFEMKDRGSQDPLHAIKILKKSGVNGLSAELETMSESKLLTMVSKMAAGVGVAVLEAKKSKRKNDYPLHLTFDSRDYIPWENPESFEMELYPKLDWMKFSSYDAYCYNIDTIEVKGGFAIRIATEYEDKHVRSLLAHAIRQPNEKERAIDLLSSGGGMIMLGRKRGNGYVPVAGACLKLTINVETRSIRAEIQGLWLTERKAGTEDMLIAAICRQIKIKSYQWEKIIRPGSEIAVVVASGPDATDRIADQTYRAMEFKHDVDIDDGHMVLYSVSRERNGAKKLREISFFKIAKKHEKIAQAISNEQFNMVLPSGSPIAVEPIDSDCEFWSREGRLEKSSMNDFWSGCLDFLRSEETRQFIREIKQATNALNSVLVISQRGLLFLIESKDVQAVMVGSSDEVKGKVVHIGTEPIESIALEYEALFALSAG